MIILSNCLTDTADEGARKVATSMVRVLKQKKPDTTVITYDSRCSLSDVHLKVNKLLLNRKLLRMAGSKKEELLYIPSPAKMLPLAVRLLVLSRAVKAGVSVVLTMPFAVKPLSKKLLLASGAKILALCEKTKQYYSQALDIPVRRLCAGVDAQRFCPVSAQEKEALRQQYGLPAEKPIVLHVGHLKKGRNVAQLLNLPEKFHGVLVVSPHTAGEQDGKLKAQLLEKKNITLIEDYIPQIQQIYQLSDVYLFPVVQEEACIDSPLSALEAAACGIPVVTTDFGEMKSLLDKEGFYQISSFDPEQLTGLLEQAIGEKKDPRPAVLAYDWQNAVNTLLENL